VRDTWFSGLSVAPIRAGDQARFDAQLDEHHWLGHRMVGETMRYAATDSSGEWVALLGFASPAFSCGPRDRFIGWSRENQSRRLRFVASNQRFCILPAGRRQNTASAVMSRALKWLSADWVEAWDHPVLLVETFVDSSIRRTTSAPVTTPRRLCASARPPATGVVSAPTSSTDWSRTSTCARCTATASRSSRGL
jgi:hypothetical protein